MAERRSSPVLVLVPRSPNWTPFSTLTHTIPVGNVTGFTVNGITKDNFLFGVRAIDRDGNESVVSFPVPK